MKAAVDVAVDPSREQHRKDWKSFLEEYVDIIAWLTQSEEYSSEDLTELEKRIDKGFSLLITIGGQKAVTNYFHYLGSGHVVWLLARHGNL